MSTTVCKYHPGLPARWHCPQCEIAYCSNCLSGHEDTKHKQQSPACVLCGKPVESLGTSQSIVPFWERLHQVFVFPLSKVPLTILILLTLVTLIFDKTTLGLAVYLVTVFLMIKYAYAVLEDTAKGYIQPKSFEMDVFTTELELPFKQIIVLFIYGATGYLIYYLSGKQIAYSYFIILAFILPASIMLLAVKHTFTSAFNFKHIFHVVRRIGWPYLMLYGFLLLFVSAANILAGYTGAYLPEALDNPARFFVYTFFLVCIFYLMGYALYQYHDRLGFEIDFESAEASVIKPDAARVTGHLKEISILVQEGAYKAAMSRLENMIENTPGDMDARAYYQKLVTVLELPEKARAHCADFVSRLIDEKLMTQAMQVFLACYKKDKEVTLNKPVHRYEMATLLLDNNHPKVAMALLNNMHKDFPTYDGTPQAYLLAARIMTEQFNQDDKARQILEFVIEQYPGHQKTHEVKRFLRALEAS